MPKRVIFIKKTLDSYGHSLHLGIYLFRIVRLKLLKFNTFRSVALKDKDK